MKALFDGDIRSNNDRCVASKYQLLAFSIPVALFISSRSFSSFYPLFDTQIFQNSHQIVYEAYAALLLLEIAMFVIAICLSARFDRFHLCKPWLIAAAGVFGFAGAFLIKISHAADFQGLFASGLVLTALYSVMFLLALGEDVSCLDMKDAGLLFAYSGVAATFFRAIVLICPEVRSAIIITAPVVSAAGLLWFTPFCIQDKNEHADKLTRVGGTGFRLAWLFAAAAFLCAASAICSRLLSSPFIDAIAFNERALTLYVTVALIISLTIILEFTSLSENTLSVFFTFCAMLFVAALLIVIALSFRGGTEYGVATIKSSQQLFEIFLLINAALLAKKFELSPITAFGLYGIFAIALPGLLANGVIAPISMKLALYASPDLILVITFITLGIVVVLFVVFAIDSLKAKKTIDFDIAAYNLRLCEEAARNKGITSREIDVMRYLYQGYEVKKIADTLCIAPSTVQSHSRNIYRKMGVHSRQELIDQINDSFV